MQSQTNLPSQSFSGFMAWALYDPEAGYYACNSDQVGRAGDFFTSVSVGPLFGKLLSIRFAKLWHDLACPSRWRITECGAHDGSLAYDILISLHRDAPAAAAALEYAICEPLPRLACAQQRRLAEFSHVVWHDSPESLANDPLPGVVFGNEVLDALPFDCVVRRNGRWWERRVIGTREIGFQWVEESLSDSRMLSALASLGNAFPDGYQTEIRTGIVDFLAPLIGSLSEGMLLWIDYGFEREDYYHPARRTGTLRTFSRHRAGENPLETPGEVDITAHVDFTAVVDAAMSLGALSWQLTSQGTWLTRIASDWLLSQEGNPDRVGLRQFQTLTHPGHLGSRFHMLEIAVAKRR